MAKQSTFTGSTKIAIIHGKEHFLMEHYTVDLESALAKEYGDIDRVVFDGETIDLATVLDEVRTFDLLMRYKLVIIDHADTFLARKNKDNKPTRQAIERYAESPVESATLLLRAKSWRPGKLDKIVSKVGTVCKLQNYTEQDTVRWCIARCEKAHKCKIDSKGASTLVSRIGLSLTSLDSELCKLSACVSPETSISNEDVLQMVRLGKEEQAWEIQSVLLTGNEGAAMTKLCELMDISKQPKELLMWSVVDLTRRLSAASTMLSSGLSGGDVRKSLKLFGDAGNRILSVAKRQKPNRLADLFTEAVAVDVQTRSGLLDGRRGLESIALHVCKAIRL